MERTELKMAVIAEQLGLSWAGKSVGIRQIRSRGLQIFLCLTSWLCLFNNIRTWQPASAANNVLLFGGEPQSEWERSRSSSLGARS